jgi:hypothetical protein
MSNYFVARVQKEFARGGAGFLTTSVTRRLDTTLMKNELLSHAVVFGGDAFYFLDDRQDWVITGELSGSHVAGSAPMIQNLQRASQRYYQRPDAPHVEVDPERRSLDGFSGRVFLHRNSGVWQVNAALWGVSPGFESNDLGFHTRGDRAGARRPQLANKLGSLQPIAVDLWVASVDLNFNREVLTDIVMGCGALLTNYWWPTVARDTASEHCPTT